MYVYIYMYVWSCSPLYICMFVWSSQATIAHLRKKLECAEFDIKKLSAGQEREGRLKDQVKVLTEQLLEAKRHHTPVRYY